MTILAGGSVGKEAGALQIGASLGTTIAKPFHLHNILRRENHDDTYEINRYIVPTNRHSTIEANPHTTPHRHANSVCRTTCIQSNRAEAPQPPALATTGVSNAWPITLGLLTLLAAAILVVRHRRELEDGE